MRLVSSAYGFLKNRGFLPSFGKFSNIAFLMGCPVRGVILDTLVAMQYGHSRAGTQFWDEKLSNVLAEGKHQWQLRSTGHRWGLWQEIES
ncbi:hypothetical protein NC652_026166 [Populus alba x Populus x berolinensis]|nr:hypothetical protein NC652_026166 [Populus alba x Populus x berolinensis]